MFRELCARVNSANCMMGREKKGEGFLVLTSFSAKPGFQPPLQNCEADVWQGIRRTSQCLLLTLPVLKLPSLQGVLVVSQS